MDVRELSGDGGARGAVDAFGPFESRTGEGEGAGIGMEKFRKNLAQKKIVAQDYAQGKKRRNVLTMANGKDTYDT